MDKVPGSYKHRGLTKSDVHEKQMVKEIPAPKGDVEDELYDYTKMSFPGYMGQDPEMARDIGQHIKHHAR